uniref:Disease resistance protein winged helix domain-containing protein n=1 Tax=Leersia perrieri TaxID=77586 RepID=A0A0D9W745_9ORYZ
MNQLHRIIANRLEGKRLVRCTSLLVPLKSAAPGSKIVATTRSAKVARMMALKILQLGYLTDTACWSVCQDAALQDRDPSIIDDALISMGKSVESKCKGLPLAANAAGSVLSIAIDRKHWETVEQSDLWANNDVIDHTLPALLEYVFRKEKVVRLWLAQGFAAADGESHAEDTACEYFQNLVEKFFLQRPPSYDHNEQRYGMHDLYHELAEYVAADEYSRIERFTLNINGEAHHLSLAPIQRTEHKDRRKTLSITMPSVLFKAFVCLRALDFSNTDMEGCQTLFGN